MRGKQYFSVAQKCMVMEMAGRMSISIAAAVEIWDVVVVVKGSNKVIALVQRQRSIILSRR